MARKTWEEKLNADREPEVKPVPKDMAGMKKGQIMLIPTAKLIDQFVQQIPEGKSIDAKQMREQLAKQFNAEVTCPITSGIHLRVVAEAAFDRFDKGASIDEITPFWRVIDPKSPLIKKVAFDANFILDQRQAEGLD